MKYLMCLRYVGTNFCGSQIQPSVRTVQGVLNDAFEALFGVRCMVTSCSRTDSGVHANGATLTVALPDGTLPIPPERLPIAVMPHLPPDVGVYGATAVPDSFHVRHDAQGKEYVYLLYNSPVRNPFYENRAWFYPRPIDGEGLERMKEAAGHLLGTHDFAALMAQGSPVATTVRTLQGLRVLREGELIRFEVEADGFLYNMVRIIVGTLVEVAAGRISPEEIPDILASCDRTRAGMTAPPEGLYLNRVFYTK
ncbi:MAG: tRNA pseudouridine(38-40) synthase TruA [Clostridia bacterium]|nr:tRNA pseudouridine(38-40) synthase TruA [Clostridia bacterium]